jgi:hypothetical protein
MMLQMEQSQWAAPFLGGSVLSVEPFDGCAERDGERLSRDEAKSPFISFFFKQR